MKKLLILLIAFVFAGLTAISQEKKISQEKRFSQMSLKNVKGDSVSLASFSGKKVLFIVVPMSQDDSIFKQLQDFKNRYKDSIKIIGVLSLEDGYTAKNAQAVQNIYSKMGIILTEGMYTKKTSGEKQSPVMQWLTDRNKNKHYDMDSKGVGQKFFVNEGGKLYAVMPPQLSLNAPIIDRIVHAPVMHPGNRMNN